MLRWIPRDGATQSLLCIVLETKLLVFASVTSDRRQIIVRVCQHPDSPVQCKQPQVIMQTVVSDHMAAGMLAVCLSNRLVQSALALQFNLWRLGHQKGRCKNRWATWENMCAIFSARQQKKKWRRKKSKYWNFIKTSHHCNESLRVAAWGTFSKSGLSSVHRWWKNWIG